MSFSDHLRGLFRPTETKADAEPVTLTDPLAGWLFGAMPTTSGQPVGPISAMSVPAVSSAVELISETAGTLPVKLYRRTQGGKVADPEHPAYRLVHDEANDWTSATGLRTDLTRDALLHDAGGFALANRVNGRVVEFIRLDPGSVSVETDQTTGEPFFWVRQGKTADRFEYSDILHIQAFGGRAPINRARNAIALSMTLEEHASRLFGHGAHPSGVLKSPNPVKPEQAAALLEMWTATHGGASNSGKPALLTNGIDWEQTSLTSVDAQFEQLRRFQIAEIARAFRTPPTMVYDLERGTWSNTAEMGREFLTYSLRPWLKAWEWAYARVLLTPEERNAHYIEFITDDLLSTDHENRARSYGQYRSMGAITANEVRAGLNLPPIAGADVLENPYTSSAANDDAAPKQQDDAA